jgi:hypothetical protein
MFVQDQALYASNLLQHGQSSTLRGWAIVTAPGQSQGRCRGGTPPLPALALALCALPSHAAPLPLNHVSRGRCLQIHAARAAAPRRASREEVRPDQVCLKVTRHLSAVASFIVPSPIVGASPRVVTTQGERLLRDRDSAAAPAHRSATSPCQWLTSMTARRMVMGAFPVICS